MPARPVSRWHPARTFSGCWWCREDEIGGYKARKYLSLIPALKSRGVSQVLLRGGSHSNNVLQLALRLKQEGIRPYYKTEGRPGPLTGNGLYLRMVLGDEFDSAPPGLVEIPEGASCPESLPGSLTLAAALAENWRPLDGIFMEAGTGFSAAALVLGLGYLGIHVPVTVVWLGDRSGDFSAVLERWRPLARQLLGKSWSDPPWRVVQPPTARSFGSVNRSVLVEVARLANSEGLLVDPIYTAKLSLTARSQNATNQLLYCGGGATELSGFQESLGRIVR